MLCWPLHVADAVLSLPCADPAVLTCCPSLPCCHSLLCCAPLLCCAGHAYSDLKAGLAVLNSEGAVVQPHWVVTPNRRGRRIAVLGDCGAPGALAGAEWMRGADVVVAGTTYLQVGSWVGRWLGALWRSVGGRRTRGGRLPGSWQPYIWVYG